MNKSIQDKKIWNVSGLFGFVFLVALVGLGIFLMSLQAPGPVFLAGLIFAVAGLCTSGFVIVQPLEAKVVQWFGNYVGTITESGLRYTIPFTTKQSISLRLRNFESPRLKVNEAEGNPIEIGAIVVWKVIDSAQATFSVDVLGKFVEKQTESALRMLATQYPYDKHEGHTISLHGNLVEINEKLREHVRQSLQEVGVSIEEARISHLAYAPEIAAAMLQRQQAQAIISARQKIVEGAVGMVDLALQKLEKGGIVKLDDERKAAMVSNLLVVLCSERPSQPIVNTGSIY